MANKDDIYFPFHAHSTLSKEGIPNHPSKTKASASTTISALSPVSHQREIELLNRPATMHNNK